MPIRVTCRKCHTRFTVSDRFAGKEGPCPKCKSLIKVPAKSDEVVIHEPKDLGPKNARGQSLVKPIFRREVTVSPLLWTIVIGIVVTFFVVAFILRLQFESAADFPIWILVVGAIAVAGPAAYGAYGILRDSELGAFLGGELWARVCICGAIYAALWGIMPLLAFALRSYDSLTWIAALGTMIAIGGLAGSLSFDFEYLVGVMHYGLYLCCTLLLRWVAGVGVLPGQMQSPESPEPAEVLTIAGVWLRQIANVISQRLLGSA